MTAVVDSGPLISLAPVGQVALLREQCGEVLIVPAVEREVIALPSGCKHVLSLP
jgi:predicted nucleic acid-binding protein